MRGSEITALRTALALSQDLMARILSVSHGLLASWEVDKIHPGVQHEYGLRVLQRLAYAVTHGGDDGWVWPGGEVCPPDK